MKRFKKIVAVVLIVAIIASILPAITQTAEAISQDEVSSKLSEIINARVGGIWKDNSFMSGGKQCYEFAHYVFNTIFDRGTKLVGNGASSSNATCYKLNNVASDIKTIGILEPGYSSAAMEQLLEQALPGDFLQVKKNLSSGGTTPHSMIVTSVNPSENYIMVLDANASNTYNLIQHRKITFSTFKNKKVGASLYRHTSYNGSATPAYEIDTRYPTPFFAYTLLWWNTSNGKTPVYTSVGGTTAKDYIYNGYNDEDDKCTIHEVYTNGWCKITVPGINGYRYCQVSTFVGVIDGYNPWYATAPANIDAYKRWDHGSPFGYIGKGASVCVLSETSDMYQVVYWKPDPDGYYCSWVDRCDLAHSYKSTVTQPTCTAQGYTTYKCSVCGDSYKDNYTAATGHSYAYKATKNPTMSATGTLTGTCSKCSGTTTVTLPKLNTTDYTKKTTKAATCTATGTDKYTWKTTTYGTFSFNVTTKATGHTEVTDKAVAPTCTATGLTEGKHCSVCNAVIKAQTTVAALGHDYSGKVTAPTCTAQGYTTYTCSRCSDSYKDNYTDATKHTYTYKATKNPTTSATGTLTGTCSKCSDTTTVTLPKLNTTDYTKTTTKAATCTATGTDSYKWKTTTYGTFTFTATTPALGHDYVAKVTAPTCETQGYTTYTCSRCSDSYKDNYTDATKHTYTYKATKNPTTSATGTLTGTCSKCSGTTTVTLPKLNTTDYTKTITKAATCTATGTDKYTWKTTTYGTFSFNVTTAAKGHTEVTDKAVAPTCTATGLTEGKHCSVCNAVIKAQTTVAALGHDYSGKVTAPTCTAQGYTTYTCSRCSDSYKDNYTDATKHTYTYKATKNPTTSATGTLTGTCSKCSGTTTVTLPKLNTTDYTYKVTKAATCTATGTGRYTWKTTTYGSFYFDVTIAKTNHDYKAVVTNPTCTAQGYTTHTCAKCQDSYKDSYTDALGHDYSYKVTTTPTTSATGTLTGTCSKCSGTTTVTLPKLNTTDYTYKVTKAPTCTATGTGRYTWKTTTYGSFYFDVTIAKTNHDYKAVATNPTCTAQGYTTYTCSVCGNSYQDGYTNALGHSETDWITDRNPTCTASGSKHTECNRCGITIQTSAIPAIGHSEGAWIVDKEASCTASGSKHTECVTCGAILQTVAISATGHDYADMITEPTCTETGYTTHTCSNCGDSYKDAYVGATGHAWNDGIEVIKPTCTKVGERVFTCGSCGETRTEEIAPLGHSYETVVTAPTCTEDGYTTYTCSVCGDSYVSDEAEPMGHNYDAVVTAPTCTEIGYTIYTCVTCADSYVADETAATGHDFENGLCTNCGEEDSGYLPENPFVDVKESDYFYTPVLWAVQKRITNGISATEFGPNANCTRGQIVTFLWRACGSPEPQKAENPFTDVKSTDYYYKAVLWAVESGITNGMSETTFAPDATCTRGQVATFLWRSQGKPAPASNDNPFKDVKSGEYYYNAVLWAVENNITNGTGIDTFSPDASCTRGQIVTFLYRALAE